MKTARVIDTNPNELKWLSIREMVKVFGVNEKDLREAMSPDGEFRMKYVLVGKGANKVRKSCKLWFREWMDAQEQQALMDKRVEEILSQEPRKRMVSSK